MRDHLRSLTGRLAEAPGTLLGALIFGGFGALIDGVAGTPGVFAAAAGAGGSEAMRAFGLRLQRQIPPDDPLLINHNLQDAFREACLLALADIAATELISGYPPGSFDQPDALRFTAAPPASELHSRVLRCLQALSLAIEPPDGLIPRAPAASQPAASAYTQIEQTSMADLSSADTTRQATLRDQAVVFFDTTIAPWLDREFAPLLAELPALRDHLRTALLPAALRRFNEVLKSPERTQAWRAFNRLVLETIRSDVRQVAASQAEISTSQADILQRLDMLLTSTQGQQLAAYADGMASLVATVGTISTIRTTLDAGFELLLESAVQQRQDLQLVLAALAGIQQQSDQQYRVLKDTLTTVGQDVREIRDGQRLAIEASAYRIPPQFRTPEACPYPGLASFEYEQAYFYVGREAELAAFLARPPQPVVGVIGASGVGKSSFVRAGVVAHLRGLPQPPLVLLHRVSTDGALLEPLAATLAQAAGEATGAVAQQLAASADGLYERLLALAQRANTTCWLVLDQLEELTAGVGEARERERGQLLDALVAIIRHASPAIRVIATTRLALFEHAEYRQRRAQLEPWLRTTHATELHDLSETQIMAVMTTPLERFNAREHQQLAFEPDMLTAFQREITGAGTSGLLPIVQFMLRKLWLDRHMLDSRAYASLLGLHNAFETHGREVYQRLESGAAVNAADALLVALVRPVYDPDDPQRPPIYTRRRVRLANFAAQRATTPLGAAVRALANADNRLVVELPQPDGSVVLELAHQILIDRWAELKILQRRAHERVAQREQLLPFVERWKARQRRAAFLPLDMRKLAHAYLADTRLSAPALDDDIQAYVQASDWQLWRLAGLALLVVVALVLGVRWLNAAAIEETNRQTIARATAEALAQERATAQQQAQQQAGVETNRRRAQQLQTQVQSLRAAQPMLALRLALEGLAITPPTLADERAALLALVRGISAEGRLARLSGNTAPDKVFSAVNAPSLVLAPTSGPAELRAVNDGRLLAKLGDKLVLAYFSPDRQANYVLLLYGLGTAELRRSATGELVRSIDMQSMPGEQWPSAFQFSQGETSEWLAVRTQTTLQGATTVRLFRTGTGEEFPLPPNPLLIYFAPDNGANVFLVQYRDRPHELRRLDDGSLIANLPASIQLDKGVLNRLGPQVMQLKNGATDEFRLTQTGELLTSWSGEPATALGDVKGRPYVAIGSRQRVDLWNIAERRVLASYEGIVNRIEFSPVVSETLFVIQRATPGERKPTSMFTSDELLAPQIGDARTGALAASLPDLDGKVVSEVSPPLRVGGETFVVARYPDGQVYIYDTQGKLRSRLPVVQPDSRWVLPHRRVVLVADERKLMYWPPGPPREANLLDGTTCYDNQDNAIFMNEPAQDRIVVQCSTQTTLVDATGDTWQIAQALGGKATLHTGGQDAGVWNPQTALISVPQAAQTELWAWRDQPRRLTALPGTPALTFNGGQQRLISSSSDGSVDLYDSAWLQALAEVGNNASIEQLTALACQPARAGGVDRAALGQLLDGASPQACPASAASAATPTPRPTITPVPVTPSPTYARPTATPLPAAQQALIAAVQAGVKNPGYIFTVGRLCVTQAAATARIYPPPTSGTAKAQTVALLKRDGQWQVVYSGPAEGLNSAAARSQAGLPERFVCLAPLEASAPVAVGAEPGPGEGSKREYNDIIGATASFENGILTAVFRLRGIPAEVEYNRPERLDGFDEYAYRVYITLDAPDPVLAVGGDEPDYELEADYRGKDEPVRRGAFQSFLEGRLFENTGEYYDQVARATVTVDQQAGTITLVAPLPELARGARLRFQTMEGVRGDGTGDTITLIVPPARSR